MKKFKLGDTVRGLGSGRIYKLCSIATLVIANTSPECFELVNRDELVDIEGERPWNYNYKARAPYVYSKEPTTRGI